MKINNNFSPTIWGESASQNATKNTKIRSTYEWKVDKNGHFTKDFNRAAGIDENIKIHSSTMENLIKEQERYAFKNYITIDFAKTIGNAYKIISQLINKSPELRNKDNFSQDDLAKYFPQNYIADKYSLEVKKIFSFNEVKEIVASGGFKNFNENEDVFPSFFEPDNGENSTLKPFDTDLLHSSQVRSSGWNINADKYTNADGSITMGGLLVGFLANNIFTGVSPKRLIAGEATVWGKLQGLDENIDKNEIKRLSQKIEQSVFPNNNFIRLLNGNDLSAFEREMDLAQAQNGGIDFFKWLQKIIEEYHRPLLEMLDNKKIISKINALKNIDLNV